MLTAVYKIIKPVRRQLDIGLVYLKVVFLRLKGERLIFLLGVPEHNNVGDLAITQAEVSFIKKFIVGSACVPIPYRLLDGGIDFLHKLIRRHDNIAGHGGGNMGDTYVYEERIRRSIIDTFPNNKIIIFPQTIYFSKSKIGEQELRKTQAVYSKHNFLTIIAREKISFDRMKKYFPHNMVILTPDIVLSMLKLTPAHIRKGALVCIRNDIESMLENTQRESITKILGEQYNKVYVTDTTEPGWSYRFKPNKFIVWNKLNQFRHAEVVVTDRLHGMVFCVITGTPCVAMTNFNHKVMGTYEWIKKLNYIKFINDINELESALSMLKISEKDQYNPGHFNKYWTEIAEAFNAEKKMS